MLQSSEPYCGCRVSSPDMYCASLVRYGLWTGVRRYTQFALWKVTHTGDVTMPISSPEEQAAGSRIILPPAMMDVAKSEANGHNPWLSLA